MRILEELSLNSGYSTRECILTADTIRRSISSLIGACRPWRSRSIVSFRLSCVSCHYERRQVCKLWSELQAHLCKSVLEAILARLCCNVAKSILESVMKA